MRYWLIGCGILLVLFIVSAVFIGNCVYKQYKEIEEVGFHYKELEVKYPFVKPDGGIMTSDQIARFATCRKELLDSFLEWKDQLEDEDISIFKKISASFGVISSLGKSHVNALDEVNMSLDEYLWITNQVKLALKYAESPEAPQELKDLRAFFDEPLAFREGETGDGTSIDGGRWKREPSDPNAQSLLPQVDPSQLKLPQENIQAILASKEDLKATMEIFYFFDPALEDITKSINAQKARK